MQTLSFKHSGRLGDIVYALPLVKILADRKACKADLYILNDNFYDVKKSVFHPGEGVTVSQKLFDYIHPLLDGLAYVNKVIYCSSAEAPVDCLDLDSFKKQEFNLLASGNQVWYRKAFSVPVPFEEKWLLFKDGINLDSAKKFRVIVNKSTRYYNKSINYAFLDEIENAGFVGLKMEYEDFVKRNQLKNLTYVQTNSALNLTQVIANADVFLGNQSLGFAIAEGLKVARAVEVYEPVPVVIPIGGACIEFIKTPQLIQFMTDTLGFQFQGAYPDLPGGFVDSVLDERPEKFSKRWKKWWRKHFRREQS